MGQRGRLDLLDRKDQQDQKDRKGRKDRQARQVRQEPKMQGQWCFFRSFFSPEQCEIIIRTGLTLAPRPGTAGGKDRPDIRRSEVRFLEEKNSSFKWIFDMLWTAARQANHDYFGFDINHLGYLQLAEYKAENEGEYKRHQDVFWINKTTGHRKLSCVVQLTDPSTYTGGDLQLEVDRRPDAEKIRTLGTVIFFPSFTYHAALPVKSGNRYSLAAWFDGPKWR